MDKSSQKHQVTIAVPDSEPGQDLDVVFSTFFKRVEQLKPVSKPRSAKDYLQSNRDKIIHALSKGYTYSDLAEMLNSCGFSISASTLRRYIGPVKGSSGDAFDPEFNQETATDSSGLPDESNPSTTIEEYQPKLRPRRK